MDPPNDTQVSGDDNVSADLVFNHRTYPIYRFLRRHIAVVLMFLASILMVGSFVEIKNILDEIQKAQKIACESGVQARNDLRDLLEVALAHSSDPNPDSIAFFQTYIDQKLPATRCVDNAPVSVSTP